MPCIAITYLHVFIYNIYSLNTLLVLCHNVRQNYKRCIPAINTSKVLTAFGPITFALVVLRLCEGAGVANVAEPVAAALW